MVKGFQTVGFLVALVGLFGTIDHLWGGIPVLGVFRVLNRQVIQPLDVFDGWELVANLAVLAAGVMIMLVASGFEQGSGTP